MTGFDGGEELGSKIPSTVGIRREISNAESADVRDGVEIAAN